MIKVKDVYKSEEQETRNKMLLQIILQLIKRNYV